MSRTNVNYERKYNDLLHEIWNIFLKNGYENTTLALIIKELGISKGAFYHYFPTKEACAAAAIDIHVKSYYEKIAKEISENAPAIVNLKNLIISSSTMSQQNEKNIENLNTPMNSIFHQKLMAALVKEFAPLYAKVISQGIDEKIFHTPYPLETAQMILTLSNFYFDADLFGWNSEEMQSKLLAFENLLACTLKADPEIFSFLHKII